MPTTTVLAGTPPVTQHANTRDSYTLLPGHPTCPPDTHAAPRLLPGALGVPASVPAAEVVDPADTDPGQYYAQGEQCPTTYHRRVTGNVVWWYATVHDTSNYSSRRTKPVYTTDLLRTREVAARAVLAWSLAPADPVRRVPGLAGDQHGY